MHSKITVNQLPPELFSAIQENLKEEAERWITQACASANNYAEKWGTILETPLTGGALSLCIAGQTRHGEQIVIKIPTDTATGQKEIAALTQWEGKGCPRILTSDEKTGVFLMEYLQQADQPIKAKQVFQLAHSLHNTLTPVNHPYPPLNDNMEMRIGWAEERFSEPQYAHHQPDLQHAKSIYQRLIRTTKEETLLHGDFQRKNLIQTVTELKTIDPYACIGDPIFDAAFWLALVHHDTPLEESLKQYPVAEGSNEYRRFLCWTWTISVIENRPYEKQGVKERQHFINTLRTAALQASELI